MKKYHRFVDVVNEEEVSETDEQQSWLPLLGTDDVGEYVHQEVPQYR